VNTPGFLLFFVDHWRPVPGRVTGPYLFRAPNSPSRVLYSWKLGLNDLSVAGVDNGKADRRHGKTLTRSFLESRRDQALRRMVLSLCSDYP